MRVVTLVPLRAGVEERDRLWAFCAARWAQQHPDWTIVEGHHDTGPFNRSAAINRAARDAGDWDVAVIIDADVVVNPDAARTAVDIAHATGRLVLAHNERIMLSPAGTAKVLGGFDGPWRERRMVSTIYTDSVSCCLAVPRVLWDDVGGFDERFVGWGYEDSAFEIACVTLSSPTIRLASELYHLHHAVTPEAGKTSPTRLANAARLDRYRAAAGDVDAVRALIDETDPAVELGPSRIPRILHRTVPEHTSDEVEGWWARFQALHPGWDLRTYREPIDPADWPLTGDLWPRCANGAQKAGLIRLEALVTTGGVYVDADVEPFRSLEPLTMLAAFAGWEDETTVPDAVLGAEAGHPAFVTMIEKARAVIEGGGDAWQSGPGVTTETLPGRPDVLILPPGAFYPAHYLEKNKLGRRTDAPYVFVEHKWHHSWGTPQQRRSIEARQR